MAFTVNKKAFCVLEFAKTESIVTVQRRFRIMYHTEPPTDKTIREWYMKFHQSGCLCAAKRRGRPGPSAETVERVREMFVRSPQKATNRASRELQVGHKLGEILYLLICSFLPCLSWLLRSRVRKSRRDLRITLYFLQKYHVHVGCDIEGQGFENLVSRCNQNFLGNVETVCS